MTVFAVIRFPDRHARYFDGNLPEIMSDMDAWVRKTIEHDGKHKVYDVFITKHPHEPRSKMAINVTYDGYSAIEWIGDCTEVEL